MVEEAISLPGERVYLGPLRENHHPRKAVSARDRITVRKERPRRHQRHLSAFGKEREAAQHSRTTKAV